MAIEFFDPNDEDVFDGMRDMFGPDQVDQQIRMALRSCWMGLPKQRRTADEVERQIRRIVDRAIVSFRQDYDEFHGHSTHE